MTSSSRLIINTYHPPPPTTTVGKDVSALIKSSKRPLRCRFSRAKSTIRGIEEKKINKKTTARATVRQKIEDETADKEYNTDEECMGNGTDIPKKTGVDNSDIKSMATNGTEENGSNRDRCGDVSMGFTEEELFNIEEKAKDNKEEDDEEEYKGSNDERDDDSSDNEEEDYEEEDSEEENNDETASDDTLSCAGDLCKQQESYIIIGQGHQRVVCRGRMHGFPCFDGKVEAMVGMTCKECNNNNVEKNTDDRSENSDMVLVEETEGNGSKVVNGEWSKIQHKKKSKNQIQNKNKNNKNKHHNQDAGKRQTGT